MVDLWTRKRRQFKIYMPSVLNIWPPKFFAKSNNLPPTATTVKKPMAKRHISHSCGTIEPRWELWEQSPTDHRLTFQALNKCLHSATPKQRSESTCSPSKSKSIQNAGFPQPHKNLHYILRFVRLISTAGPQESPLSWSRSPLAVHFSKGSPNFSTWSPALYSHLKTQGRFISNSFSHKHVKFLKII